MNSKGFITLSVLILLFLPLLSAVEFDVKQNYSQGETMIAKLSGNFLSSVSKENIVFYRESVKIPVEYDIAKIGNDYYIYAVLSGKSQGSYSVSFENVRYMKGSEISQENIVRNFLITEQTADFSVNPGFAVTASDFFIEVQNLQDKEITINIKTELNTTAGREIFAVLNDAGTKSGSLVLSSGEIKDIQFKLGTGEKVFKKIELKSSNFTYEIPVYIYASSTEEKKEEFRLEPSELIVSASTNTDNKRTIYLYNTGTEELRDIVLSFSNSLKPYANVSNYKINKLAPNSNIPIDMHFFSSGEAEIKGHVKASASGMLTYSQISLKFLSNYIPPNVTAKDYAIKTCAQLQGTVCGSGEACNVTSIKAKDDWCCIRGTCVKTFKSYTGRIIGVVIVVVVAAGLVWFYKKKYKGAKKPFNLLKIAKRESS